MKYENDLYWLLWQDIFDFQQQFRWGCIWFPEKLHIFLISLHFVDVSHVFLFPSLSLLVLGVWNDLMCDIPIVCAKITYFGLLEGFARLIVNVRRVDC
jgi:hypothetical protein